MMEENLTVGSTGRGDSFEILGMRLQALTATVWSSGVGRLSLSGITVRRIHASRPSADLRRLASW